MTPFLPPKRPEPPNLPSRDCDRFCKVCDHWWESLYYTECPLCRLTAELKADRERRQEEEKTRFAYQHFGVWK